MLPGPPLVPRKATRLLLVERDRLVRHRTAVINQMRDLVMTAPDELRARLRGRSIAGLVTACAGLRERSGDDLETRIRVQSLRRLARRALEPGLTSPERAEFAAAKKWITEPETELAVHRRARELLGKAVRPKDATRRSP